MTSKQASAIRAEKIEKASEQIKSGEVFVKAVKGVSNHNRANGDRFEMVYSGKSSKKTGTATAGKIDNYLTINGKRYNAEMKTRGGRIQDTIKRILNNQKSRVFVYESPNGKPCIFWESDFLQGLYQITQEGRKSCPIKTVINKDEFGRVMDVQIALQPSNRGLWAMCEDAEVFYPQQTESETLKNPPCTLTEEAIRFYTEWMSKTVNNHN